MKTLQRKEALELWNKWWNETQKEWFKIEVLQDYSGEDVGPSLDAWLTGDKEKSIKLMAETMKEWIEMCQRSSAIKKRFHIVKEPYTPYLEWEIELYKRVSVPLAGELVCLIPEEKVKSLHLPDGDVMIFDEKRVVRNHYNSSGFCESMDFYESGEDDIQNFLFIREEIQKLGIQKIYQL